MAILKSTQIKGDLTVTGSLNVQGNLTYVGVENLRVKDHQIELNANDKGSASLAGADKAGIVIRGAQNTTKNPNSEEASILYNHANDSLVINKTIEGTVSNATTAASADKVAQKLTVNVTNELGTTNTVEFDGSAEKTVSVDLSGLQNQINSLTGGAGSIATQINDAINKLDAPDAAVDGQYVSSVSEENGKITVTRAALPDYTEVYDAKGAAAQALTDAKAYANGLNTEMDGRVQTLEGKSHTHANKAELDQINTGDVAKWNAKQNALTETQLAAVNSGITSTKVSEYGTHVADTTKHITANERKAWNAKQNALSEAQLNAVNSGITKARVDNYEAHVADANIHVTTKDKDKWNAAEANANKYTDNKIGELGTAAKKNVLTGAIADSSSEDLVTAAQVKAYAAGVVGAMHFRGAVESTGAITDPASGDICLVGTKEYVYNGTEWVLFGDESAYDVKGSADQALKDAKSYADGLNTAMDGRVDDLESASHTHTNKAELDKIVDGDKKKWDDHVANADIHVTAEQKTAWDAKQNALANANVLSAITDTQVTNWDNAAAKAHEHANKTVLDGITEAKVKAWDDVAKAAVVNSVGGKSGALTLKGGSATLGDVNLSISDTGEISAAIVPNSFDVKGAAAKALTDANAYTDGKVNGKFDATGSAATAKSEVIGTIGDAADKDTIYGAKKYADTAVSALSGSVAATDAAQDTKIANIEKSITGIQNNYVKKAGDTMTGNLTMPSNGTNGIVFGNMKIVWKDNAIEFVPVA